MFTKSNYDQFLYLIFINVQYILSIVYIIKPKFELRERLLK